MFTILGADGKEYGPVSTDKIVEWIHGGRANLQTKARRDGEVDWKTLGEFPEFASTTPLATVPPAVSGATPRASATPLTGTPKEIADDLLARGPRLDVFGCIDRNFNLWKNNFLPLVGVTFVVYIITLVIGMIPVIGPIFNLVLGGVFYAGLYYYYLGKLRGEPREFGDAFAGFSLAFGPLVLVNIMMVLILLVAAVILIGPWMAGVFYFAVNEQPHFSFGLVAGAIVCSLPIIYFAVAWCFASILVIDRKLSPWTAMEVSRRVVSKQWFRVFFTLFLSAILGVLGVIALIIGVFFTLPLTFGGIVCAYEAIFNPPARSAS